MLRKPYVTIYMKAQRYNNCKQNLLEFATPKN